MASHQDRKKVIIEQSANEDSTSKKQPIISQQREEKRTQTQQNVSVESAKRYIISSEYKLRILHQNVQYAGSKSEEIEVLVATEQPDIFIMTEQGMKENQIKVYNITGYKRITDFSRSGHKGGGVAIYVSSSINECTVWPVVNGTEMFFEAAAVQINVQGEKCLIIGIYRSPNSPVYRFLEELEAMLDKVVRESKSVIVMGDININTLEENYYKRVYCDLIRTYNLKFEINCPTRCQGNSKTQLDHVISNIPQDRLRVQVRNTAISDHSGQVAEILGYEEREDSLYVELRQTKISNLIMLNEQLKKEDWGCVYGAQNIDEKWESFCTLLNYYVETSCPKKFRNIKLKNKKRWITKEILVAREEMKSMYDQYKTNNTEEYHEAYKSLKKAYRKEISIAKKKFIQNDIERSKNIAKTVWSHINVERKGTTSSANENIVIEKDGNIYMDPKVTSNILNEHYSTVVDKLLKQYTPENKSKSKIVDATNSLFMKPTSETEVGNIIRKLKTKNSEGLDGISTRILKHCAIYVIGPLSILINLSLEEGIFPACLKKSKVVPIYKGGNRKEPVNYRPVTVTSVLSKVIETIIKDRIINFMDKNNILDNRQHGFRRGRSTLTAINELISYIITALDKQNKVCGLFLDLSKAFDCVSHTRLLEKLQSYGIRGKASEIIKSFLQNRVQAVTVKHKSHGKVVTVSSDFQEVKYGVPQGTVMGPILFILYTNDMAMSVKDRVIMYADDTSIIASSSTMQEMSAQMTQNIENSDKYFRGNNLFINGSKTKYMLIQTKKAAAVENFNLMLGDSMLEEVTSYKFLGVEIDRYMTWEHHIQKICSKISTNIFLMRKMSTTVNKNVLLKMYYGLIFPHLSYCIVIWGGAADVHTNRLLVLQKKAIRCIAGIPSGQSCRDKFKELNIMTVPTLYIYETILFVKLNCSASLNSNIHDYNTRKKDDYRMERNRLKLSDKDPINAGKILYNHLPQCIKNIDKAQDFRKKLKTFLICTNPYSLKEYIETNYGGYQLKKK